MKLIEAIIPNGEVSYVNEETSTPTTTETNGNVTIRNAGSPGTPAYFEVSFQVSAKFEAVGIHTSVFFTPSVIVSGKTKDSPFRDIEAQAARDVAPMLRAIADEIERTVAEYDAKHFTNASSDTE